MKAKDIKTNDSTRYVLNGMGVRGVIVTVIGKDSPGVWRVRNIYTGGTFTVLSREILAEVL
jgi:hypothetical protein